MDGGRKVVGGSAKGWTPPGPKLIGELAPGGNITNIYFLSPQFEKDRMNQVRNVKMKDLIMHLENSPHSIKELMYYTNSDGNVVEC